MQGETGLYPVTSKLVRDEWEKLRHEKLQPWMFMEVGEGLHVVDFYGRNIRYCGVRFAESPRDVFWGRYVDPFLEDIALRLLDRTVALCKQEGHELRSALVETGRLLKWLVRNAFNEMADIDQRLLGKGYPGSVPKRSTETEVATLLGTEQGGRNACDHRDSGGRARCLH